MSTFGVTMHGPPNGQAVLTLSLFNMSHPLDRAWCKKSFDTTSGASGKLSAAEIDAFLCCFYRARAEGETLSGGFVPRYPPKDAAFLRDLVADGPVAFPTLLAALESATGSEPPEPPIEYNSSSLLREDMQRHTRRVLSPQQQFRTPQTTSQEVGWEVGIQPPAEQGNPFHIRTSATTLQRDTEVKCAWGRSVTGEYGAYAMRQLNMEGGFGMGI